MKTLKKCLQPKTRVRCVIPFFILVWALMAIFLVADCSAASVTDGALRFRLDNGLTIILKKDQSSPVVAIQMWIKTGSANETQDEAGIAHLIEHMFFKGTPSRQTGEIARTIEASGGHINAYTSFDRTVYYVEIPKKHLDTALDILLDAVQHSIFDPRELEREKEVVLEEYRRSLDMPHRRLARSMMDLCYQAHPYKRPIIGYESTIRSFDREAALNYIDKWYTPENIVLVAVGDLDTSHTLKTIKTLIKDFPKRRGEKPSRPVEPEQTALRKIVLKEDVQQVYLDMCWHVPSLRHPDLPALDVMEMILGHGKSSRLYSRLKMQEDLVHSIDASNYALADPGLFCIDATLSPDKFNNALDAIVGEAVRIGLEPVAEPELSKAKTIAEADFIYDMETMTGQARTLAFFQAMTNDMYHADDYLKRLRQITSDDITRVSKTYFSAKNLSIAVMAPTGSEIDLSSREITGLFAKTPGKPFSTEKIPQEKIDTASKVILSNGMRVIIKENHRLPVVSITAAFLGGTRLESPKKWGISNFVGDMLTRGTINRTASDIASTVESCAGRLNGFSGRNSFGIKAKFLSKDFYPGLELLAEIILSPGFPEPEIEKVRGDILAGIKAKKDRPTPQLFDLFYKTLFQHYPYGHPGTGTTKTIQSIQQQDLVEWYGSLAMPSNLVLTVVGDVNQNQLIPYVKKLFRDFAPGSHKLPHIPPEPPLTRPGQAHLERPGAQTHLVIGYLGTDLKSKYNAPMALIDTALSGQGGRLFFKLRDKQSLAYSVSAFRRPGLETGVFGVYLACDPQKLAIAKTAVFGELDKIREQGLTEEELASSKKYLLGNLQIGLQSNASQAMLMALDELYGLGYDHVHQFIRDIEAVTHEDITRAVNRVIIPGKYVLVTVGPGPKAD